MLASYATNSLRLLTVYEARAKRIARHKECLNLQPKADPAPSPAPAHVFFFFATEPPQPPLQACARPYALT